LMMKLIIHYNSCLRVDSLLYVCSLKCCVVQYFCLFVSPLYITMRFYSIFYSILFRLTLSLMTSRITLSSRSTPESVYHFRRAVPLKGMVDMALHCNTPFVCCS
jgi:hypothetical protein